MVQTAKRKRNLDNQEAKMRIKYNKIMMIQMIKNKVLSRKSRLRKILKWDTTFVNRENTNKKYTMK